MIPRSQLEKTLDFAYLVALFALALISAIVILILLWLLIVVISWFNTVLIQIYLANRRRFEARLSKGIPVATPRGAEFNGSASVEYQAYAA